ncbi:AB hydrolase superfamily protein B1A11.02 [Diplodia seriata]|uniref:AB hydrolase superfamily protein B1A11.02 n=1 Tax=Diplodia seriata TaxID=420778 RepID=A0A1S8BDR7_9PEZI|nr:AB hydrolase superfamily protein B1A11.02 [Diplodia seriata]
MGDLHATRAGLANGLRSVLSSMPPSYMEGVEKDQVEIPMRDGAKITVLLYKPSAISGGSSAPLAVLYHGGGHVMGVPEMEESNAMILVRNHGCIVVSVGYRLAPEHNFPVPIDDSWDAFKWVVAHAFQLGADPSKGFLVGGSSAGANIAAVVSHLARDEKVSPPLTGVFLAVPTTLPEGAVPEKYKDRYRSRDESKSYEMSDPMAMLEAMSLYQGDDTSPLYAPFNWPTGHAGLPRTYLAVCGMDPLRDEGLLYEYVLRTESRVETKMDFYPGMPHGFWAVYSQFEASKKANADIIAGWAWLLS